MALSTMSMPQRETKCQQHSPHSPHSPYAPANFMDPNSFVSSRPNLLEILQNDRSAYEPSLHKNENTFLTIPYFPTYLRFALDTLRVKASTDKVPKANLTLSVLACLEYSLDHLINNPLIRHLGDSLDKLSSIGNVGDLDEYNYWKLKAEDFVLLSESFDGKKISVVMTDRMMKSLTVTASKLRLSKYQTAILCCALALSECDGTDSLHHDTIAISRENVNRFFKRVEMATGFIEICLRRFEGETEGKTAGRGVS